MGMSPGNTNQPEACGRANTPCAMEYPMPKSAALPSTSLRALPTSGITTTSLDATVSWANAAKAAVVTTTTESWLTSACPNVVPNTVDAPNF